MILRPLAVTTMALAAAAGLYQEPLRPRFHFTPPQNFMMSSGHQVHLKLQALVISMKR